MVLRIRGQDHSAISPLLYRASIGHSRHQGTDNAFAYRMLMASVPAACLLDALPQAVPCKRDMAKSAQQGLVRWLRFNRFGLISVRARDYGACMRPDNHKGTTADLQAWIGRMQAELKVPATQISQIRVLSLPRVLGYVFRPVSFWFFLDETKQIRAVVAEVNNTSSQSHAYVCQHDDGGAFGQGDVMKADKVFHVSPFFDRDGTYAFRFSYVEERIRILIDHRNGEGALRLKTWVDCNLIPEKTALWSVLPVLASTLSVFPLILWQALKLKAKGVAFHAKPTQRLLRLSQAKTANQPTSAPSSMKTAYEEEPALLRPFKHG